MPGPAPPYDPSRPRGLLTTRDRKFLLDELGVEPQTQREREIRGDIRERVWNGLLDFVLLARFLDERDARQIYYPDDVDAQSNLTMAFQELITTLYRYSSDGDPPRRDAFTQLVEGAIIDVDTVAPEASGERLLTLRKPDVRIEVDYPRTVDLDHLEQTVDSQPEDVREWDWQRFEFDELLVLFWTVVDAGDGAGEYCLFDALLLDAIRERLNEQWHFAAPWTDAESIALDLDLPEDGR